MTTQDRFNLSGFSCPTCMISLGSSAQLQDHWIRYHSHGWKRKYPSSGWSTPTSARSTFSRQNSRADGASSDGTYMQDCIDEHEFVQCIISNATVCEMCHGIIWNQCKQCRGCRIICHYYCNPKPMQSPEPQQESSVHFTVRKTLLDSLKQIETSTGKPTSINVSYITDRLIDVSFPSSTVESVYTADIENISAILKRRHGSNYAVFNISERRYDISSKNEKVLDLGWPDHLAPPLDRLISIVRTIDCWFAMDPQNVAVLHCKGGRSRIAVIVATFTQYSKRIPRPQTALGWFSLCQYYKSRLAGKLQPSQRRYVTYVDDLLERKFKLENKVLQLDELVLCGLPLAADIESEIHVRIYQGYQLVHTTEPCLVKPGSERITIKPSVEVSLVGDTLIKCCFSGNIGQQRDTIFRCQFHVDAIDNNQLVLQKAELDGISRHKGVPENCFVEMNFTPMPRGFATHDMDAEVSSYCSDNDLYRGPKHVPGPLNGNPYAQIDHSMKLRARQMADQSRVVDGKTTGDLGRGIKDLDDLLGELGHLTQAYQSRKTKKDMNSNNVILSSPESINLASNGVDDCSSKDSSSEISSVDGESKPNLPPRSSSYSAVTRLHVSGVGKGLPRGTVTHNDNLRNTEGEDFVFPVDNEMSASSFADEVFEAVSPTVHDLLNELNRSTLNSVRGYSKKHNASAYDNYDTSGTESNDGDSSGADSYRSGMVASHVKQFNELWSCPDPSKVAAGVPLPGLVQGVDIEDRIFKYNTRSLAPGQRGPQNEQLYLSGSPPTRVVYEAEHRNREFDPRDLTFEELKIKRHQDVNGNDDLRDDLYSPDFDVIHKPPPEFLDVSTEITSVSQLQLDERDGQELDSPEIEVRPGSDSAYGDSSSLSTPVTNQTQNEKTLAGVDSEGSSYTGTRQSQSQISDDDPAYMKIEDIPVQAVKPSEVADEPIAESAKQVTVQNVPLDLDILDIPLHTRPAYKPDVLLQGTSPTTEAPTVTVTDTSSSQIDAATLIQQSKELLASLQKARIEELKEKSRTIDPSVPLSVKTSPPEVRHTPPNLDLSGVDSARTTPDRFARHSPVSDSSSGIHYVDSEARMRSQEEVQTGREQFVNPETPRAVRSSEGVSSISGSSGTYSAGNSPSPTRATLRRGRLRRMGSSGSSTNMKDLFPEVARYPHIKFDHITLGYWYKPDISRDEAIRLLKNTDPGTFVVRDSKSYGGAFGLAVKVATPPLGVLQQAGGDLTKIDLENELVRHFLIEPARQGVRLKGSTNEPYFPSLVALIYQHSVTKMALPVNLKLPTKDLIPTAPDQTDGKTMSEQELLSKGVGCDVVYLRAIHVEGLSGEGAVVHAMEKLVNTADSNTAAIVNFKVDQEGITLTDNERRVFFRKHFQLRHVLYCTVDPQNRRWNLSRFLPGSAYEANCFAIVVSRPNRPVEHDCHVFAELNADQPSASVVVSFVDRALKLAKK